MIGTTEGGGAAACEEVHGFAWISSERAEDPS